MSFFDNMLGQLDGIVSGITGVQVAAVGLKSPSFSDLVGKSDLKLVFNKVDSSTLATEQGTKIDVAMKGNLAAPANGMAKGSA